MNIRDAWMDIKIGIERETHRMSPRGEISRSPQPERLQPPAFTKDFAESQLEIVTRPHAAIPALVDELDGLTQQALEACQPEVLWPFSMPPALPSDSEIAIARLGADKKGQDGERYRHGLALRYGKARQMICGVHVNVSIGCALALLAENTTPLQPHELNDGRPLDALYLRLVRNLLKDLPHLVLLTGASPLLGGADPEPRPAALSYRNSRYGYARSEFRPYLDLASLAAYVAAIRRGLATESAPFQALATRHKGVPQQLNTRIFQQEKEFYAPIRFKRTPRDGESSLDALARDGVDYLELRFFDVDPFSSRGISEETLRLVHLMVVDGLLTPSDQGTRALIDQHLDAAEGAALSIPQAFFEPTLDDGQSLLRLDQARQRLEALHPLARKLDTNGPPRYLCALERFMARATNPSGLPAVRLLRDFEASHLSWTAFGMESGVKFGINPAQVLNKGKQHAMDYAIV